MVNVTINGQAIQAAKGKTILEVAKEHGIFIPYLCFHPALECPICDKGGECELQEMTHALGIGMVDYEAIKTPPNHDYESLLIERHPDRCIKCGRCVRICRDRVGAMAINFMNRAYFTELGSGLLPLDCEFCGSCIDICPGGALINKLFKYRARAWEVTKTEMVW